jgi:hypothetical protein
MSLPEASAEYFDFHLPKKLNRRDSYEVSVDIASIPVPSLCSGTLEWFELAEHFHPIISGFALDLAQALAV